MLYPLPSGVVLSPQITPVLVTQEVTVTSGFHWLLTLLLLETLLRIERQIEWAVGHSVTGNASWVQLEVMDATWKLHIGGILRSRKQNHFLQSVVAQIGGCWDHGCWEGATYFSHSGRPLSLCTSSKSLELVCYPSCKILPIVLVCYMVSHPLHPGTQTKAFIQPPIDSYSWLPLALQVR